jgi:hypothetical protein
MQECCSVRSYHPLSESSCPAFRQGGWLEQHVFQQVASVSGELHIRDKAANLEVTDSAGVKNEMDVAFMARNRLLYSNARPQGWTNRKPQRQMTHSSNWRKTAAELEA